MTDGEWTPAFPGQRPPFARGNTLAVKHGGKAVVALAPRAEEIAEGLREIVPAYSESDEPTVRLLALTLAQVEAASAYVAEHGLVREDGQAQPILKHLGTITNTAARLCDRLGLTPTSRAALGVAVSQTRRGEALRRHLEERYGAAGDAGDGG